MDWRLASGSAALLAVLFAVQQWIASPAGRREVEFGTSLALQAITWGTWLLLLPSIVWSARRHPLEDRPSARLVARHVVQGFGFVIVHAALAGFIRWAVGLSISSTLALTIVNSLFVGFATNFLRYSAILIAYQALVYHDAVRERDRHAARLEIDLAQAKLADVEARLRPHFLFNTLNAIAALVRDDPAAAEKMIGQLSDLLRAALKGEAAREVPLEEELTLVEQYLDIERVRFLDRLRTSIEASDEARQALVPHLLLQPLVENAVRHGIAPLEGGGSIAVKATREDGRLHLTITDDGLGIQNATGNNGTGIGLSALRARLAHLYGEGQRLDVQPAASAGTVVTIDIPYRSGAS
jgi:two-component system LytT family sensor kinase